MKKQYRASLITGILLVALAIFWEMVGGINSLVVMALANAGVALVVIAVVSHNSYGAGVAQDERTRKLSSRAVAHSWLGTFVLVNLLFWIDQLELAKITFRSGVAIILYFMLLTASVLQFVYKRKPDTK